MASSGVSLEDPLQIGPKMDLPKEVANEFSNISKPEEDIQIATSSDMNLDGIFEDNWFIATDKRILVFSGNHSKIPKLTHEVPISEVEEVRLKNYIGNGVLEVKTANKAIELL